MAGDAARVFELVERRLVEADRKRLDASAGGFRHQPDDEAGVDAAREERAKRDVADQMRADGVAQNRAQVANRVALGAGVAFVGGKLPVPLDVEPSVLPREQMT